MMMRNYSRGGWTARQFNNLATFAFVVATAMFGAVPATSAESSGIDASVAVPSGSDAFGLASETFLIESMHVDEIFEINVSVPSACQEADCSVLYFTDSDWNFGIVSHLSSRTLPAVGVPPMIAVGIGYKGDYLGSRWWVKRLRDLLAVHDTPDMARILEVSYVDKALPDLAKGAPKFLEFIREELIPTIESRYNAKPDDRVYFGHSGGSIFGTFVLTEKPDTFNRYVLGSGFWPSHLERLQNYAKSDNRIDAKLYVSNGLDESLEFQDGNPVYDYTSRADSFTRFVEILHRSQIPGLNFTYKHFPDEMHFTSWFPAFIDGMRWVYLGNCKPYLWPERRCPEN